MNNKDADQTAQIRRLICAFVVSILHKQNWVSHGVAHNAIPLTPRVPLKALDKQFMPQKAVSDQVCL